MTLCARCEAMRTIDRAPPGPRSLATVVNKCARSINRSFMVEQGSEGCVQEQDCLQCRFQGIIKDSPSSTGTLQYQIT